MPINAGYEYAEAQKHFAAAKTTEEKIVGTEEMLRTAPKHKGSENLIAQLRLRLSKLRKEVEKLENYIRGMKDLAFYLGGAK